MYHCDLHFYLAGQPCRAFEIVKEISPLAHFTHEFWESAEPEEASAARADVILANLEDLDVKEAFRVLTAGRNGGADLILLADKEQVRILEDRLPEIKDIWILPISDGEIRFRFLRWQQGCKADRDLWQTSHYLEATINNVPSLIWYKDKNGIHRKVNDSFCKTVNKTKAQVEGRGHAYIWNVEHDDPACIESELEVMTKEKTCVSEETIKTGDGTRQLMTYKSPLYDLDGSVMGTVGVAIDVTQERAYEQEIMKKNRTLETIFTTMDCGILCHTTDGAHILSVNQAALKILDYESQEELEAEGFDMVASSVVGEDKPKLRECIRKLKNEGDSVSLEYRVRHKDGEMLHVMGNIKLVQENGNLFYQRFLLDCTAQKLEEKENERRQTELIQALSIDYSLVCYFDLDTGMGMSLRFDGDHDHALDSVFNGEIAFEESMEFYIRKCVYKEDREMLRQTFSRDNLKKELEGKNQYYVNYRTLRDGEMKYFEMKVVRAGIWGKSHGIVLGSRSVDEETRREMEQRSLLEDALLQANRANKAKSTFLSNMSHDIRTPMNAIVGFTNLAITEIDHKEQVEEYLKKIMMSGEHLLSLINDVLDMSRIESGRMRLEERPCSLPDILHELQNIVQTSIHEKQLGLRVDMADVSDEEIYCDKLRLNQVLMNLLSNSIKYTNAGGTVSVSVTEKAGASPEYADYEFCIKDNGIGMSKEFIPHVFEPFEREKNTTISKIQGTGLGMSITKNIVDMMNGSIDVQSEQGVGTAVTVSFTFRLNTEAKRPKKTEEENKENGGKKAAEIHTGRILVAEDTEINQEVIKAILSHAGYSVEIAENGQIAVDMLKKNGPGYYQLVFMDIQMPVMDGYEAARTIRALENEELSSIPILAMTANAFEEDKQEALKCGMNGHIAKPIDVKALFDTLGEILA